MSRFMNIYQEPVQEGIGNWLWNSFIDFAEGANPMQTRVKLKDLLNKSKYVKYIESECERIIKKNPNLTHKFPIDKSDVDSHADYNQRRYFIHFKDYILDVNLNQDGKSVKDVMLVMLEKGYKHEPGSNLFGLHFFKIRTNTISYIEDMDAKFNKVTEVLKKYVNTNKFGVFGDMSKWCVVDNLVTSDEEYYNTNLISVANLVSWVQSELDESDKSDYMKAVRKFRDDMIDIFKTNHIPGKLHFQELGYDFGDGDEGFIIYEYKRK